MNEPQVWTVIGVFATALFAMLGITVTLFSRMLKSEIGSVRAEIGSLRNEMNSRFDAVNAKIDHIDRDVQSLMRREFGENHS